MLGEEQKKQQVEVGKKRVPVIIAGVATGILIVAAVCTIYVRSTSMVSLESRLELGNRYLSEMQYEQAIAEFEAVIAIDPGNEEAYLALADVYIRMNDYEAAVEVLQRGVEQAKTENLTARLAEVREIREAEGSAEGFRGDADSGEAGQEKREPWEETVYEKDGSYRVDEYDENGTPKKSTGYYADGALKYETEYDKNGNPVKTINYNPDGTVNSDVEYSINEGRRIETRHYTFSIEGTVFNAYQVYEYDENGTLLKCIEYSDEGSYLVYDYEHDENGNLTKCTLSEQDGTVLSYEENEYDENGNRVKHTFYNPDGAIQSYQVFEYDINGNQVKSTFYNADGTVLRYNVNEYAENGNLKHATIYDQDGTVYVDEYDENGTPLTRTTYNADGTVRDVGVYDGTMFVITNTD